MTMEIELALSTDITVAAAVFERLVQRLQPFMHFAPDCPTATAIGPFLAHHRALWLYGEYFVPDDSPWRGGMRCILHEDSQTTLATGYVALIFEIDRMASLYDADGNWVIPTRPVTSPALPGYRLTNLEALFLRAMGLFAPAQHDPAIEHGTMTYAHGLAAATDQIMLYHRTWDAFARDFTHIYGQYHWAMGALYRHPDVDVWRLSDAERAAFRVLSTPPRTSAQHNADPSMHDHLAFLDWLDPPRVQRLAALAPAVIRELVLAAVQAVPDVRGYDFGDHGYVLATNPPETIWRVYEYIAQHAP